MSELDLSALLDPKVTRLLMTIPLKPLQGDRFQPTGFPSLGAADYQTKHGRKLIVESPQSMANRLEKTCWDEETNKPISALDGISHVTVRRGKGKPLAEKAFLTDSILEAHRLNSPYILQSDLDRSFLEVFLKELRERLGVPLVDENNGLVDRHQFAGAILKFDIGSLIHGVFLANKIKFAGPKDKKPRAIAGGRLRLARSLSAFIEASGASVAASGGVKNDHVNPSGDSGKGMGNVPFARDEFVADKVDLFVNLDLSQIRGYGLGEKVDRLLILFSLFKLRKLIDGDLRLRTACDFEPVDRENISAHRPSGFRLPSLPLLEGDLATAIPKCKELMTSSTTSYDDNLDKGKEDNESGDPEAGEAKESEDETPNDE